MTTSNAKGPTKIPNLYQVLNLQPKENDDQAIRSALRLYAEQVKKMEPGEPAQLAAKLFAIAKQNLLDPVKKTAYDSLWDKVFGATATVATTSTPATTTSAQPTQAAPTPVRESVTEKKKERSNANVVSAITQSVEKVVSAAQSSESKAASSKPVSSDTVGSNTASPVGVNSSNVQPAQQPKQAQQPKPAPQTQPIQEPTWDLTELQSMLPSGDPSAPLDLSAFLESTDLNPDGQRSMEDLDRDFQKLLSLLGVEVQQDARASETSVSRVVGSSESPNSSTASNSNSLFDFDSTTSTRSTDSTRATSTMDLGFGEATEGLPPIVSAAPRTAVPRATLPSARAGQPLKVRKKRDRSQLIMIAGGLTVLFTVLGVLLVMLKRSNDARTLAAGKTPDAPVVKVEPKANNTPNTNGAPKAGSGLPQPGQPQTGSGLPKPGENMAAAGNDASMLLDPQMPGETPAMPPANNPAEAMQPAPPKPSENATEPTKPNATQPDSTKTDPAKPDTAKPDTTKPEMAKPEMASADSKPAEGPMEEEAQVELTAQEKATWKKQMRQARKLLGEREYDQAKDLLGKIEPTAKSGQQKAQFRRLSTVAELAQLFNDAMMSALDGMGASETITVGNSEITFVEFNEERLVVRTGGGQKRYPWKDLPINLAYGYAELKMDQGPKSAAAKASFAAVHTKMNPAAIENARKLMQSAAAAEVVPADTHEVFDDEYSLD